LPGAALRFADVIRHHLANGSRAYDLRLIWHGELFRALGLMICELVLEHQFQDFVDCADGNEKRHWYMAESSPSLPISVTMRAEVSFAKASNVPSSATTRASLFLVVLVIQPDQRDEPRLFLMKRILYGSGHA
jgi:hypothetical protein